MKTETAWENTATKSTWFMKTTLEYFATSMSDVMC